MIQLTTHRLTELSEADLIGLCTRPTELDGDVLDVVEEIEAAVRERGDSALREFNVRFDEAVDDLQVSPGHLSMAWEAADTAFREAVERAAANIEAFHTPQSFVSYETEPMPGVRCWRETRPIERVGLYVPSGTAPLASTLLMTAIPAKLAGCSSIVIATPPPAAEPILAVAGFLGLTEVVQVGGAQAVFALAYGTESVPRVDKIVGPGNAYVAAAKWRASRLCAVDMVAGPSEVLVFAGGGATPVWVAADLLSQAEHGADSHVVLVTTDTSLVEAVQAELDRQLEKLPRREMAESALANGFAVVVDSMEETVVFINRYAPEHLVLHLDDWSSIAKAVTNAGSVFCGPLTPESAGDYASGTNHTLPTAGLARSTSGLGVEAFTHTITYQALDHDGLATLAPTITTLAETEQLAAHARAVTLRTDAEPTFPHCG